MTDFRTLIQHNDLRSQLGLVPSRRAAELSEVIGDALRIEAKPLNPANATPDPLHRTIAAMGCSSKTWGMRNALAVNKLFSATGTSNVVVNVVNNGEPPTDQNASEIVANIRKMIDSPEVQRLRAIGGMAAGPTRAIDVLNAAERFYGEPVNPETLQPYPKMSIKVDGSSQLRFDARALSRLIPPGVILIKGMDPADYVAQFPASLTVLEVTYEDIKSVGELTVDQASVLRGCGIYAVGGYFLGGPINKTEPGKPIPRATNFRALPKVNDCLDTTESDVLELLVLAGANPHTDRRRLDAARTQFELAFMMLKKAVDPEQERE